MKSLIKPTIKHFYYLLLLFLEASILVLLVALIYNMISMPRLKTTFYLPHSDVKTIMKTLNEHGYPTHKIDKYVLKHINTLPKKGWYTLDGEAEGRFAFFNHLYSKRAKTIEIELFAGETSTELTRRLANDLDLNQTLLLKRYKNLTIFKEGDLLAGRYIISRHIDENTTMNYLFKVSDAKLTTLTNHYLGARPTKRELQKLLTIASVIQKESHTPKEMPLIASVIYNRLKKNMRLQMDGTLNYGVYAHTIITSERIKTDNSLYNTYKHKGLPPTPLSTVSIEALESACRPKKTNYLFFMLNTNGTHTFTTTYNEHLKKVHTFKTELRKTKNAKKMLDTNISWKSNTHSIQTPNEVIKIIETNLTPSE